MYDRILVPTDGSPGSEAAVEEAFNLAELTDASVYGLFVVDTRDYSTLPEAEWIAVESELEREGEAALKELEDVGEERGVPVETSIEHGVPHRAILEQADERDVDLIVMGTHGRTGVRRFLIGSVAEKVVRSADVPVLVKRIGEDVEEAGSEETEEEGEDR